MQSNVLATASFEEILDDLSTRFIINIPEVELQSVQRICFQVEQAHWFYEDFVRLLQPNLPSFQLKTFSEKIFKHCPLLKQWAHQHEKTYSDFMQYRFRIPVCGAIILNENLDKCLLVKGWSSKSGWSFPRGKINENEKFNDCAIREVLEETGYDISPLISNIYLEKTIHDQSIRLYVVHGVPENTDFQTQTRKEISQIEWFKLDELPGMQPNMRPVGRFYMVVPFIGKLKTIIPTLRKEMRTAKGGKAGNGKNKTNGNRKTQKAAKTPQPEKSISSTLAPPSPPKESSEAAGPKSLPFSTSDPKQEPESTNALKSILGITQHGLPLHAVSSSSPDMNSSGREIVNHLEPVAEKRRKEPSNVSASPASQNTVDILALLQAAQPPARTSSSSADEAMLAPTPEPVAVRQSHTLLDLLKNGGSGYQAAHASMAP
ncbi:Dcp2, box A domain-containing protein [Dichotomocladium elegans]|nr:Dcp2, box A domain-containing protein [Dichotomocladium elegans]